MPKTITEIDWQNKIAVLRADLNVPIDNSHITDNTRIVAAIPTILSIIKNGGGVIILSHLGRPKEGEFSSQLSLRSVANELATIIKHPVDFFSTLDAASVLPGKIALVENTRFNIGERENNPDLAKRYASKGDIFVMDAFASAHRTEASVVGIADYLPTYAGLLVNSELQALSEAVVKVQRPLVGVFGGAKISTKLPVLKRMVDLCDFLILGGGIANTLLATKGHHIGKSLIQHGMENEATDILNRCGNKLLLPEDAVVALSPTASETRIATLSEIEKDDMILDVGPLTLKRWTIVLKSAKTIIWNGPVGLFEQDAFANGTSMIAQAIAHSTAYSLIGGGDTIAAAQCFHVMEKMSYVSTAGGALLEYLAGDILPGLVPLSEERN